MVLNRRVRRFVSGETIKRCCFYTNSWCFHNWNMFFSSRIVWFILININKVKRFFCFRGKWVRWVLQNYIPCRSIVQRWKIASFWSKVTFYCAGLLIVSCWERCSLLNYIEKKRVGTDNVVGKAVWGMIEWQPVLHDGGKGRHFEKLVN